MVWRRPTDAPADLREGIRPAFDTVVLEAYVDTSGPSSEQPLGGQHIGSASVEGNITRWAVLPSGADWLDAGSSAETSRVAEGGENGGLFGCCYKPS
jgi:hypothetical protein